MMNGQIYLLFCLVPKYPWRCFEEMKKFLLCFALLCVAVLISSACLAEDTPISLPKTPPTSNEDVTDQVEADYLDLIDQHAAKLTEEYNASTETETLLVRRAVKNYIVADLVDYTMLIFMAKYNVATGGIDMKKANAEILESLRKLSVSANEQMLQNINALRIIKGKTPYAKAEDVDMGDSGK
jgi:hypothetical protein